MPDGPDEHLGSPWSPEVIAFVHFPVPGVDKTVVQACSASEVRPGIGGGCMAVADPRGSSRGLSAEGTREEGFEECIGVRG
jgi:hypothetical protein